MSIEDHYASCAADGHCVTCSDEALPATVVRVDHEAGLAIVTVDGQDAEVDVTLVDEIAPGHVLLVHGGVAIAHLQAT